MRKSIRLQSKVLKKCAKIKKNLARSTSKTAMIIMNLYRGREGVQIQRNKFYLHVSFPSYSIITSLLIIYCLAMSDDNLSTAQVY